MVTQRVLELVQGFERFVGCRLFSEVFPHMFDRIKLGAVWRLGYQSYVLRNAKILGHVPSGPINQHDNEVVFEVLGDFLQK